MSEPSRPSEKLLASLRERAKELACLYAVEEELRHVHRPLERVMRSILELIPAGWQFPDLCHATITLGRVVHRLGTEPDTPWREKADVTVAGRTVGALRIYYQEPLAPDGQSPFLPEETRLLGALADRLGSFLQQRAAEGYGDVSELFGSAPNGNGHRRAEWRGALHLLRKTDQNLYVRIARKMMNMLCWSGVEDAQRAMLQAGEEPSTEEVLDGNFPRRKQHVDNRFFLSDAPFEIAASHMPDDEILARIERWILEDRASSLVKTLASGQASLGEIAEALRRYRQFVPDDADLSRSLQSGMRVALIRRFLTEQLEFITVAKEHIDVADFVTLLDRMVMPAESHGKLGGKASGLFLATRVLERTLKGMKGGGEFRVPRSWYVASDGIIDFIEYNNMEEVIDHKYKEIDQIRREYPHLVQLFKNAQFPPELVQGLSLALDDFGDQPLIVRSSSLLEDRLGTAFSGKYKSLFLANRGSKRKRLDALLDAVAEIYASTFGPDPIEYRRERNLLDFNEEMGILIQEVVGRRVGRYFLPAFSGVAFSTNEFRWSPRIRRQDGLLRLVPGLGTRAVDRVADDYPVLIAPGQPGLRANITLDEIVRYSPQKVDVIDLETESFETLDLRVLLESCGCEYPGFSRVFSQLRDNRLIRPSGLLCDAPPNELVVTFEGLVEETPFVSRMAQILSLLQESLGTAVDLELASDGVDVYLLQCRPQSRSAENVPAAIPADLPSKDIVFSATRHVSNGLVPDVTHVVYVDPERYGELAELAELVAVGRAVGRLNKILPKRSFILMGPGRWGSRGDIKLGVNVTYSDINNTSVLIEIARKRGSYVPDLSFGTHFFQDLVEASIRYLPLYPDDPGVVFDERFLCESHNLLAEMLPEFRALERVVHVIDVPAVARGRVLRIAMNAEVRQAVAYLAAPSNPMEPPEHTATERAAIEPVAAAEDHWRWRLDIAERLAAAIDAERYGVKGVYLFGSTKNATATAASDIDLIVHVDGDPGRRGALEEWLSGWDACLVEHNYLRTGTRAEHVVHAHFVTDEQVRARAGVAGKIDAITDAARPLLVGSAAEEGRGSRAGRASVP